MEKFYANINGTPILFTEEGFGTDQKFYAYHKISNVVHMDGPTPKFIFDYEGQRMSLPYDIKNRENLMYFFYRGTTAAPQKKKRGCLKAFLFVIGILFALFILLIIILFYGNYTQRII